MLHMYLFHQHGKKILLQQEESEYFQQIHLMN